jgi:hypothetical protein
MCGKQTSARFGRKSVRIDLVRAMLLDLVSKVEVNLNDRTNITVQVIKIFRKYEPLKRRLPRILAVDWREQLD